MTTIAMEYEKETCGRCGGSGQYSYNQIDGSRCYGCGGSGQRLTKRGAAAKAKADEMLDLRIEDLPEGRKARYSDFLCGRRYTFSRVEEKEPQSWRIVGEKRIPMRSFDLLARQSDGSYKKVAGVGEGIKVRMIPTEDDIKFLRDYQDNLTKAGKPRKRKVA